MHKDLKDVIALLFITWTAASLIVLGMENFPRATAIVFGIGSIFSVLHFLRTK